MKSAPCNKEDIQILIYNRIYLYHDGMNNQCLTICLPIRLHTQTKEITNLHLHAHSLLRSKARSMV